VQAAKRQLEEQREINRKEFSEDGELVRLQHEGYRQGLYVRILLKRVPPAFTTHFQPSIPVVVGGLLAHETAMGFITARIKRHRWHRRILKSNDPLIFSIGWRRYQVRTSPLSHVIIVAMSMDLPTLHACMLMTLIRS